MTSVDYIELVPYDEVWPALFEQERARLERVVGCWVEYIEHVGSTAVPGLTAKSILDIMVGVRSLPEAQRRCIEPFERLGYEYRGDARVQGRLFFRKGIPKSHHLHVAEVESAFWEHHLLFRDYLRTHRETALEYAGLKCALAECYLDDRVAYTEAKTAFISEVVQRAREDRRD